MKISFEQMIVGLDKLFSVDNINSAEEAEKQLQIIEGYIDACGYTWDDVINFKIDFT